MSPWIGLIVALGLVVLLAAFAPKIRGAYLKARNNMREAALRRRMKS
jgi:hypothetical protein